MSGADHDKAYAAWRGALDVLTAGAAELSEWQSRRFDFAYRFGTLLTVADGEYGAVHGPALYGISPSARAATWPPPCRRNCGSGWSSSSGRGSSRTCPTRNASMYGRPARTRPPFNARRRTADGKWRLRHHARTIARLGESVRAAWQELEDLPVTEAGGAVLHTRSGRVVVPPEI